ncbi:cyclic-phosphate processing receiver domain-containing protein [Chryseobacterium lathyri]|uniref:Cyclic-phosphate processing Receiver domain-containing protein n=1 Tax=Chryseobacterium lathyri TaxID=395933 RepID=A0ABT9SSU5_9FLAO|nr:cyclic-phosphate processing receiver domain-containing protein [Chryseobacterium lathyri]MDP9961886.1 hypothetical protein [Chryseobacterium lathyri]
MCKGLPEMISFDHDLADIHYLKPDSDEYAEKTGYECAKWLIEYCMDHYLDLPKFYCHSMNPVGKENILSLLKIVMDIFRLIQDIKTHLKLNFDSN